MAIVKHCQLLMHLHCAAVLLGRKPAELLVFQTVTSVVGSAGINLTEKPWLREVIPAAEQLPERRRPLIYVYDLPTEFNSRMLQYRLNKVPLMMK